MNVSERRKECSEGVFRDQRAQTSNKDGRIVRVGTSELLPVGTDKICEDSASLGVLRSSPAAVICQGACRVGVGEVGEEGEILGGIEGRLHGCSFFGACKWG